MVEIWTHETDGSRHAIDGCCMITAYDSYGRAAQHADPRTSDFILTVLAGSTEIAFTPNYCFITGYSQLLALPAVCDTSIDDWMRRAWVDENGEFLAF